MADESFPGNSGTRSLTRGRQIFLYIGPFPALAFFKIWASSGREPGSLLAAACAMLVYCVFVLILAQRWDKPTYFDWTIAGYFMAITAILALRPEVAGGLLTEYAVTGIYLCMFAAAFFPPVLGFDSFTYHYAKKVAPRSVWDTSIFININRIMTFAWAGIFGVCIVLSLYPSVVTRALIPITLIAAIGIPFNIRFPDYYLKRMGLPGMKEFGRFPQPVRAETLPAFGGDSVSRPETVTNRLAVAEPRCRVAPRAGEPRNSAQPNKEAVMKVVALNSSPRGPGISKTGIMLDALVKGMADAGAEVETIHLHQKKVKNCIGCYTCWTKTPGICIQKDDMTNELFAKWSAADIAIYATPLYHFTMNATMKAFIERTLPMLEPFLIQAGGKTSHPLRFKPPRAVILSVAGFPEPYVFDQLSAYVNFLFREGLLAEIYRPCSEVLTLPDMADIADDILEAVAQAGSELVQSLKISEATMKRITQPIGWDFETYGKMANLFWKTCIQEGLSPLEFDKRNLVPRPDSLETFMMVMSQGFNPAGAADTKAVMELRFSGQVEGACHFEISDGKIRGKEGSAEKPDLVVESPFDVWVDIMTGKADGQQMFMQQKYTARGDFSLLIRMKDLFGRRRR